VWYTEPVPIYWLGYAISIFLPCVRLFEIIPL
jgi:hypothetical protein